MKQLNFTYMQAEASFYEAYRINDSDNKSSEYSIQHEGNALIDPARSSLNYELVPHHSALNPKDYETHHRGRGIAEYHKTVTGRSARMHGEDKQLSKAVGCIITLPRDYIPVRYRLSSDQYIELMKFLESGGKSVPTDPELKSTLVNISRRKYSSAEQKVIKEFFSSAYKAWKTNAGIRDEDILYAVVHMDESFPHLHIMALPTMEKEVSIGEKKETRYTFSTEKFNRKTGYFATMHKNIINIMKEDGIDASGLLNGSTKDIEYNPADKSRAERHNGTILTNAISVLARKKRSLEKAIQKLTEEIRELTRVKRTLVKEINQQKKTLLLTKEQSDNLSKNKGILSIVRGETKSVRLNYEMATALKNSKLEYSRLKKREAELAKRESKIERTVRDMVAKKLPKTIKEYEDEIIPRVEELNHRLKLKENKLQIREEQSSEKEKELRRRELEISWTLRDINEKIKEGIKKRLKKQLIDKVNEQFDRSISMVNDRFVGANQQAVIDKLKALEMPEEIEVRGRRYNQKTIGSVLRAAEAADIKQALIDAGCDRSSIDADDIYKVRQSLSEGRSIEDAADKVAANILSELERER